MSTLVAVDGVLYNLESVHRMEGASCTVVAVDGVLCDL